MKRLNKQFENIEVDIERELIDINQILQNYESEAAFGGLDPWIYNKITNSIAHLAAPYLPREKTCRGLVRSPTGYVNVTKEILWGIVKQCYYRYEVLGTEVNIFQILLDIKYGINRVCTRVSISN